MEFKLLHTDSGSKARAGVLTTDHGEINTPIFMPVGTVGSVKGVQIPHLKEDIKAQIILGNTLIITKIPAKVKCFCKKKETL